MARSVFIVAALLILTGMCFSTSHSGDGTYKLYINDTVFSDNNFTIKATAISYTNVQDVITVDNVTYSVTRSRLTPVFFTLNEQDNHTVVALNGTRNVTVTAVRLGYNTTGSVALIVVPYAYTDVESSSYDPPGPDVSITSLNITPTYFGATVTWRTNTTANGTATLYRTSYGKVANFSYSTPTISHTAGFSNLTSNTQYIVLVTACTDDWCVNSSGNFSTLAFVPTIYNVTMLAFGDTWANIYWETDVKSDERVFYRKSGETYWTQVPPISAPWAQIKVYTAYQPGVISIPKLGPGGDPWQALEGSQQQQFGTSPKEAAVMLSAAGAYTYTGFQTLTFSNIGILTNMGKYAINSDILAQAPNADIVKWLARQTHQINLKDLEDETTYEFMVSSCADLCANSSVYELTTKRTPLPPTIEVASSSSPINHGTSEVLYLRFYANNPGASINSALISWSDGGSVKTLVPKFAGDPLTFAPAPTGGAPRKEAVVSITFADPGVHFITVSASDSTGMNGSKSISVNVVKSKSVCTGTSAIYYPPDTPCTNTWPNDPQGGITYNTGIDKCHAFEVCDPSIDYVIADAESCCNGERSFSPNPPQNWGYGYDKNAVCDNAIANAKNGGAMVTMWSDSSMKLCKASYLVYGLGSGAVYMKDYYTGEFCCADDWGICPTDPHFHAGPWPKSNIQFGGLQCYFTKYTSFWGDVSYYPKTGWYASDTDPTQNNNAAVDLPPHSSINIMNTGTCVDYSFAVTTLLRKAGFGFGDIMTMNAPGHAYNLVWLPGASKYMFIDTVGNTGGDFFTGHGWSWTSKGAHQDHCTYKPDKCSNDIGMFTCPSSSNIAGC